MHTPKKDYLPAAGKDRLLLFYDPFTLLLGVGSIHRKLIHQSAIEAEHQILEIGCGTGNLTMQVKRTHPETQVVGIDPDPKALERARRKAQRRGLNLQFDQGFSEDLPYPDASFDRVLSAFMLHHIKPEEKPLAIQEVYRVLKPGGSLHLVDFQESQLHEYGGGLHAFLASKVHSRHGSSPQEVVLSLMRNAGFEGSHEVARQATIMGRVTFYQAVRP